MDLIGCFFYKNKNKNKNDASTRTLRLFPSLSPTWTMAFANGRDRSPVDLSSLHQQTQRAFLPSTASPLLLCKSGLLLQLRSTTRPLCSSGTSDQQINGPIPDLQNQWSTSRFATAGP
eukprot:TRINITY_DN6407_c0_g2_i3.p2 TRINITY_DN6407_c0_g2~~TRINITY_DN6407_c0_g2_i3.p2  ORF type:complete len:118 (-),score=18.36 TRINITY_DN6407_c0_g2_i3:619-972(-)